MRPEIFTDLSADDRRGDEVVSISTDSFPASGVLLKALGAFIEIAEKQGLTTSNERYSRMTVYLPPTEAQLEEKLEQAKESWDSTKFQYDAILATGRKPEETYTAQRIERWATKEGLPMPWDVAAPEALTF